MWRFHSKDLALLRETASKGTLIVKVYESLDLIWHEKLRHDAAERLHQAGHLRCRVKLGDRRTIHGDIWAEYDLTPAGRELLARRGDLAVNDLGAYAREALDGVRGLVSYLRNHKPPRAARLR